MNQSILFPCQYRKGHRQFEPEKLSKTLSTCPVIFPVKCMLDKVCLTSRYISGVAFICLYPIHIRYCHYCWRKYNTYPQANSTSSEKFFLSYFKYFSVNLIIHRKPLLIQRSDCIKNITENSITFPYRHPFQDKVHYSEVTSYYLNNHNTRQP